MNKIILVSLSLLTFAYGSVPKEDKVNTAIEKMREVSKIKSYFFEKNNEIIKLIQYENTCIKSTTTIEDINNCKKESKKQFAIKKKELFDIKK